MKKKTIQALSLLFTFLLLAYLAPVCCLAGDSVYDNEAKEYMETSGILTDKPLPDKLILFNLEGRSVKSLDFSATVPALYIIGEKTREIKTSVRDLSALVSKSDMTDAQTNKKAQKGPTIISSAVARLYEMTTEDFLNKFGIPIIVTLVLFICCLVLLIVVVILRYNNEHKMKNVNRQLSEALDRAEIASRAKGIFLAKMSHEIRTPMNAIIGYATLMREHTEEPEVIHHHLDKIDIASRMLLGVINDVLDMSAIENGKVKISHAPFSVEEMLTDLEEVYGEQSQANGVTFEVVRAIKVKTVFGDRLRVNQILLNLLSNAMKFTEAGGRVTLSAVQLLCTRGKIYIRFTVSDTGCGMSEEMTSRMFLPFEQESAEVALHHGGSGLGLSITKNLISMLGGSIDVQSQKGVGSTFTVELPFDIAGRRTTEETTDNGVQKQIEDYNFPGRRVLIAEDNHINRRIAVGFLERVGIMCETAKNGREALDAFLSHEEYYYDALLLDIQMPELNGYGVARAIRRAKRADACTLPIIAMTANTTTEDISVALAAGINDHVGKPIELLALYKALDTHFLDSSRRGSMIL